MEGGFGIGSLLAALAARDGGVPSGTRVTFVVAKVLSFFRDTIVVWLFF